MSYTTISSSSTQSSRVHRSMKVDIGDFRAALSIVRPSMQRGFQVQVEKSNWQDVGGLKDVKKVNLKK